MEAVRGSTQYFNTISWWISTLRGLKVAINSKVTLGHYRWWKYSQSLSNLTSLSECSSTAQLTALVASARSSYPIPAMLLAWTNLKSPRVLRSLSKSRDSSKATGSLSSFLRLRATVEYAWGWAGILRSFPYFLWYSPEK